MIQTSYIIKRLVGFEIECRRGDINFSACKRHSFRVTLARCLTLTRFERKERIPALPRLKMSHW